MGLFACGVVITLKGAPFSSLDGIGPMQERRTKKVAFVSSYPPRKCGIATFTSDLVTNLNKAAEGENFQPLVVAMRVDSSTEYDEPVKFEIRRNVKRDYISAADYINFSRVDLVSVQHEFGLFGGDAGAHINLLLDRLKMPVFTTLHTVINRPSSPYCKSMLELCRASDRLITMNQRGVEILDKLYNVPPEKITLIPHGIPEIPFVDSDYYKQKVGMQGRRTILTFGLVNCDKGIEVMLRAMPRIIEADPSVLYLILGMTHPLVLKQEGEAYRSSLQRLVNELGLHEHVIFHNRFVSDDELRNFLCATDIYVTPYLQEEQLTSGTLAFAVGSGKAVVSTPYWAACELLADGRGKLVSFNAPQETADTIIEILCDDTLFHSLRRRAYDYGKDRTWPKIGSRYWQLFCKQLPVAVTMKAEPAESSLISSIELPEPSLSYLRRLTDDTGLIQHAKFTIPDRNYGYCTDDNARAVVAVTNYYARNPQAEALRLLDIYLSFIVHAQTKTGQLRNLMNFDETWSKKQPKNDALGRSVWALGTLMANPPLPAHFSIAKNCFDKTLAHIQKQYPKGLAYSVFGMVNYLKKFPGASEIKRNLTMAAEKLVHDFQKHTDSQWQWFEDELTYDNAVLPNALFLAAMELKNQKFLDVAQKSCDFLLEATFDGEHFSFVGCNGWYRRDGHKETFDQQPIEACSTILMLDAAYQATGNAGFLVIQRKAFDWFIGENDLHLPLYDFNSKGCCDGLMQSGVNANQGAESSISFLLSLLTVLDSYSQLQKLPKNAAVSSQYGPSDENSKL